jgi:Ankyrin repeats (3 copies)
MRHLLVFPLLLASPLLAEESIRQIKADAVNTTLHNGTPLKLVATKPDAPGEFTRIPNPPPADNHWHIQTGIGTGESRFTLTTSGEDGNNAPVLCTNVTGLKPKTTYKVFGFFWIDGASQDSKPQGTQCWDIRFGLTLADMRGYGFANRLGSPDTIGTDHVSGAVSRQEPSPAPTPGPDGASLFRVSLGTAMTDAKGTLVVYTDDQALDTNQGRTCFEGVGVAESPDAKPDAGGGSSAALTLAVRAGDWETVRRELAAGADLNTLDPAGCTPLFYLCAAGESDFALALLKTGAKPDVPGQRMTPLYAAAKYGDMVLVKALLDAGAIPVSDDHNPGVGAVVSGSVKALRLIQEKCRGTDLEKSVFVGKSYGKPQGGSWVPEALGWRLPDIAAHLINQGHSFDMKEGVNNNLPVPEGTDGDVVGNRTALVKAVMNTPPMLTVVDALIKKGVSPVYTKRLVYDSVVVPWDGLSAAVFEGNVELRQR